METQNRERCCCNELENPIGIETVMVFGMSRLKSDSCNELENPIGIETMLRAAAIATVPSLQRT